MSVKRGRRGCPPSGPQRNVWFRGSAPPRAPTECMAGELGRPRPARTPGRQNKWVETVQSMPEVCKALGGNLIAEHDRLYGPGTGKAFVEGPYASDLPRALKARLRPALKRQAAQLATFEDG